MLVGYIHKANYGDVITTPQIRWRQKWPIAKGDFPSDHPCIVNGEAFEEFKARGYWANPFPEGDGITLDLLQEQSEATVIQDIKECFGWEVIRGLVV